MKNFNRMIWVLAVLALSACDDGGGDPMDDTDAGATMVDGGMLDGAPPAVSDGGVELGGCESGQPCRCPRAERDGRTYILCPDAVTYDEAVAACGSAGLDLLQVNDAEEQEWVWSTSAAMFPEGVKDVWIGLHDHDAEGSFLWPDGSEPTFTNWGPNQPDSGGAGGADEDCVEMSAYLDGAWNDIECGVDYLGFICEG